MIPAGSLPCIPPTTTSVGPAARPSRRPISRCSGRTRRCGRGCFHGDFISSGGCKAASPWLEQLRGDAHEVLLGDDRHDVAILHDGQASDPVAPHQRDGVEGRSCRA
jgi:hypothetical protein